jgi:hypothetical protein
MATARRGPKLHSTAATGTGTGTEREPSPPVIGVGDSGGEAKAEVQRRDKGCARVGRTGQRQRFGGKRILANLMAMPMRLGNRRPAPGPARAAQRAAVQAVALPETRGANSPYAGKRSDRWGPIVTTLYGFKSWL